MLIDLNSDELHRNPFIVNLDRCHRSCDIIENSYGTHILRIKLRM